MSSNQLIVFDIAIPEFRHNRIFDQTYAAHFPGASLLPHIRGIAQENGWDMMTGDIFLSIKPSFRRAVCLSNEATPELAEIIDCGVEPGVLISGESPNVAWRFYHNLPLLSKGFRHACLFRGVAARVHSGTQFHTHYWATPVQTISPLFGFETRKLLAMVSSFHERFEFNRKRMLSYIAVPIGFARILWYQAIDSHARFPDLYKTRLDAVQAFASKDEFYLFGRNWDVPRKYIKRIRDLNFANPPVSCDNKLETLSFFRFTLVFENCIFPGYVTEKIFDAMLAGTVPVYLGAPDIEDFVPPECFVDFRHYRSFDDLWTDIASWTGNKWQQKIDAISAFLSSNLFDPFREENVAKKIFIWLTEET